MVRARAWLIAVGGRDEAVPAPRGQAPACYLVGGHNVRYAFAVLPPLVSSHAVHLVFNLLVVYQSNPQLSSACLRSAHGALSPPALWRWCVIVLPMEGKAEMDPKKQHKKIESNLHTVGLVTRYI